MWVIVGLRKRIIEVFYEKCDEQNAWLKYKSSVLKAAEEVCG